MVVEIRIGRRPATLLEFARHSGGNAMTGKELLFGTEDATPSPVGQRTVDGGKRPMSAAQSEQERRDLIAREAYFRAEQRGFRGGDPVTDWLAAEAAVDAQLHSARQEEERRKFTQYKARLKAQLDTVTARLAELEPRASSLRGNALKEWRRELAEIAARRDALGETLDELRRKGRRKRDELKRQAEETLGELEHALDALHSKTRAKRQ